MSLILLYKVNTIKFEEFVLGTQELTHLDLEHELCIIIKDVGDEGQ